MWYVSARLQVAGEDVEDFDEVNLTIAVGGVNGFEGSDFGAHDDVAEVNQGIRMSLATQHPRAARDGGQVR